MKNIGYADFIKVFRIDNFNEWEPGLKLRSDGVYVKNPNDYDNRALLGWAEISTLTRHPTGDLQDPALAFPCSIKELAKFIVFYGLKGYCTREDLKNLKKKCDVLPIQKRKADIEKLYSSENRETETQSPTVGIAGLSTNMAETSGRTQEKTADIHPPATTGRPGPASQQVDPDAFISSLQVSYVDPVTISITVPGEAARMVTCKDMDIKEGAKIWEPFIEALTSPDNYYHASTYDINKRPENIRKYNAEVKALSNFSKKFVLFLNKTYSIPLPINNFNVFKNLKGSERAGTYKLIFAFVKNCYSTDEPTYNVIENQTTVQSINIKDMTRESTLQTLEELVIKYKREKDEAKQLSLMKEVLSYSNHARQMEWIDDEQLRNFITAPDRGIPLHDAMSGAEPFMENVSMDSEDSDSSLDS